MMVGEGLRGREGGEPCPPRRSQEREEKGGREGIDDGRGGFEREGRRGGGREGGLAPASIPLCFPVARSRSMTTLRTLPKFSKKRRTTLSSTFMVSWETKMVRWSLVNSSSSRSSLLRSSLSSLWWWWMRGWILSSPREGKALPRPLGREGREVDGDRERERVGGLRRRLLLLLPLSVRR